MVITFTRKYRYSKGGGVAVYIQNHIPVKLREDLMLNTVDVIMATGSSVSPKAHSGGKLL
jgi:hypothetical protein